MPIVAAIFSTLVSLLGPLAARVLVMVGVSVVTYGGVGALFLLSQNQIEAWLNTMPAEILAMMGLLKIDRAISIVFSAYTMALVLRGLSQTTGAIKRTKWAPPEASA